MRLFKHWQGFVIAFGFDMEQRVEDPHRISWCDPITKEWESKPENTAGFVIMPFVVDPEFVRQAGDALVAYQPGICIEMTAVGQPYIWSIKALKEN